MDIFGSFSLVILSIRRSIRREHPFLTAALRRPARAEATPRYVGVGERLSSASERGVSGMENRFVPADLCLHLGSV